MINTVFAINGVTLIAHVIRNEVGLLLYFNPNYNVPDFIINN
jgi:hypothetical protein